MTKFIAILFVITIKIMIFFIIIIVIIIIKSLNTVKVNVARSRMKVA